MLEQADSAPYDYSHLGKLPLTDRIERNNYIGLREQLACFMYFGAPIARALAQRAWDFMLSVQATFIKLKNHPTRKGWRNVRKYFFFFTLLLAETNRYAR